MGMRDAVNARNIGVAVRSRHQVGSAAVGSNKSRSFTAISSWLRRSARRRIKRLRRSRSSLGAMASSVAAGAGSLAGGEA